MHAAPLFSGLDTQTTIPSEGQGLWLRLTLEHTSYWDFCFLESVDAGPSDTTTSTTTTSTTADYSLHVQIYSTTFLCADVMDEWTVENKEGVDHLNGNMCLSSNNTAAYNVTVNLGAFEYVDVYGVLTASDLETGDLCLFEVSFDDGTTWEPPILALLDGQDTGAQIGDIATFEDIGSGGKILLQLRSFSEFASSSATCCLHATGISGKHVTS